MLILFLFSLPQSIHQLQHEKYISKARFGTPENLNITLQKKRGLHYNYYGYLPYWISTSCYSNFDFKLLSHISYFSVSIDENNGSLGSVPNPSNFNEIYTLAHPRGVKIHMTFQLFGTSSVENFLNNPAARNNAVNNISNFISNYNIEGANIDFEFVTSSVRDSFSKFINDLSWMLWNHPEGRKELYIAMPAVPSWYPGYDCDYLSTHSDGLFIMGYDYHWSGSSVAGPVSPTFNSSYWGYYAINTTIGDYINDEGVSPDKLILGMPYYGYDWPTDSQYKGANTLGTASAVIFKNAKVNASSYGREWDSYSQTPWYNYYSSNWHQCWYDDSVSISLKLDLSVDSSLQGAGCWALGYDDGEDDLWNVIETAFWTEPPEHHFVAEVNISALNVRGGPSIIYDSLSTVHMGDKLVAFDWKNNWYKIFYPSNSGPYYAWVWGGDGEQYKYLKGSTGDSIFRVTASLLNVRTGPTVDSTIITQVTDGQCFVPDSIYGSWARAYLPDSNKKGWFHHGYAELIPCPEDSNTYSSMIDSIVYPDSVASGDTFTVEIYAKNNGWGPLDSLTTFYTMETSSFYIHGLWEDSSRVKSGGFNGLPNQHAPREAVFLAPQISDTHVVSEVFYLSRRGNIISSSFSVSPLVLGGESGIQAKNNLKFSVDKKIFSKECVFRFSSRKYYIITFYDISGRRIDEYRGHDRVLRIGRKWKSGVYFYKLRSADFTLSGKIIKLK